MRQASGFLTEDNTFFESELEAERYEATKALEDAYRQYVGHNANFERYLNVLMNLTPEVRRFIDAVEGKYTPEINNAEVEQATIERDQIQSRRTDASKARERPSDDGLGGSFEAVEQQPDRGPMYVPDMGDRSRPT